VQIVLFSSCVPDRTGREERKAEAHFILSEGCAPSADWLIGYATALISGPQMLPLAIASGRRRVSPGLLLAQDFTPRPPELPPRCPVWRRFWWVRWSVTALMDCYRIGVASLLLLDLKAALEKLAARIAPTRFLPLPSFSS